MDPMDHKLWFAMLKENKNDIYLLALESRKNLYFRFTKEDAAKDFPTIYRKNSSIDENVLLIDHVQFKPSFVYMPLNDIETKLLDLDNKGLVIYNVYCGLDRMLAWECNGKRDVVKQIYESGNPNQAFEKAKNSLGNN